MPTETVQSTAETAPKEKEEGAKDSTPPPPQFAEPSSALGNGQQPVPPTSEAAGATGEGKVGGNGRSLTSRNVLKVLKRKSGARRKMLAKQVYTVMITLGVT